MKEYLGITANRTGKGNGARTLFDLDSFQTEQFLEEFEPLSLRHERIRISLFEEWFCVNCKCNVITPKDEDRCNLCRKRTRPLDTIEKRLENEISNAGRCSVCWNKMAECLCKEVDTFKEKNKRYFE